MPQLTAAPSRSTSTCPAPAGPTAVGPQPDLPVLTVAPRTPLVRHLLRHGGFAEHDCQHCSRSYARDMLRYAG